MAKTVNVKMWNKVIGYLHQKDKNAPISFVYEPSFVRSGIEISPVFMPLSARPYSFQNLNEETYKGLAGTFADSLPDDFGNLLIKSYMESKGKSLSDLGSLEKLCFTGNRGMGALEYVPQFFKDDNQPVKLSELVRLAGQILTDREQLKLKDDENGLMKLLQISSSAGGARAKALIAWNEQLHDIRSGQVNAGEGYRYYLLKFDGISSTSDRKVFTPSPKEYTKIEQAYYLMARDSGITMNECRLLESSGLHHFMTRRFDRTDDGKKIHMQSLCGLAHMDFRKPRVYSYSDAAKVCRKIGLPQADIEQLYRRMVFNECAVNFDDHTKNISFLMDRNGTWHLSPAYDITFSYKEDSQWISAHQMLINGKSFNIEKADMLAEAKLMDISQNKATEIIEEVLANISNWMYYADVTHLSEQNAAGIKEKMQALSATTAQYMKAISLKEHPASEKTVSEKEPPHIK